MENKSDKELVLLKDEVTLEIKKNYVYIHYVNSRKHSNPNEYLSLSGKRIDPGCINYSIISMLRLTENERLLVAETLEEIAKRIRGDSNGTV